MLLPLTLASNYDPNVIIMGGHSPATNTTEIIDLGSATPAWKSGPNMSQGRIEMNAVILPDGRVLAVGGSVNDEDTSTASLNADLLAPDPNNSGSYVFSSAGANSYARLYHSVALLLPDATVWLAGGNPKRGGYVQQMEIYQPPYLFDSTGALAARPSITGAPSAVSYGNAFSVQTPDAATINRVVLVRNGTVTHAFGMDQREVELAFSAQSGSLAVTAPPNGNIAPPGYYMLFLLNSSGVPSVAKFVQVTSQQADFSVTALPSSRKIPPGTGATYSVSVTPSGGFNDTVSFSVSGLPSGATATFNPSSITGSGSSTLSIATSSSTPPGNYPLTITATSGNLTHTAKISLQVADFSLSASPSSQTVGRNSQTTFTVSVAALGPFSAPVTFLVSGLPARASSSFVPTSVTGSGTATLTITTKPKTPVGTYTLTIKGKAGSLIHSTTVTLVVD